MVNQRRIRRLHLNAPTESFVRRGAILVEDAFHTASLPNPGGRLLVVRSLSLGVIRSTQSSAAVALAIERRMRLLDSTAVYAEDPASVSSNAVFFHDEVEPYLRLAFRLCASQNTEAWFWPLAVAGFYRGMPAAEALRHVITSVVETPPGVAAAVAIVSFLVERDLAGPILAALRADHGTVLLRAAGCSALASPITLTDEAARALAEIRLASRWTQVLSRWIARWGAQDPRSLALAVLALIAEKPARLLDHRLPSHAHALTLRAYLRQESQIEAEVRGTRKQSPHEAELESLRERRVPSQLEPEMVMPPRDQASTAPLDGAFKPDPSQSTELARVQARDLADPTPFTPDEFMDARLSTHAGAFFLLPAMARLGIENFIQTNPGLIECDVPARVLLHAIERFGAEADDPVLAFLRSLRSEETPEFPDFIQPATWKRIIRSSEVLVSRVEGSRGERLLLDRSGRIALARWRGAIPASVRELSRGAKVSRASSSGGPTLNLLLDSWLISLRRWCRRWAGIGLRELIQRRGRVSMSRTHVEVVFDHRQADIRIRRAGLDLNPGWLPWFGHVVAFHYRYGESSDEQ